MDIHIDTARMEYLYKYEEIGLAIGSYVKSHSYMFVISYYMYNSS